MWRSRFCSTATDVSVYRTFGRVGTCVGLVIPTRGEEDVPEQPQLGRRSQAPLSLLTTKRGLAIR